MGDVGQRERPVQDRVVLPFAERLGYRYLGNRQYRPGNSNTTRNRLENLSHGVGEVPGQVPT